MKRWTIGTGVVLLTLLAFAGGCKKKDAAQSDVSLTKEAPEMTAAGVEWSYPSRWTKGQPRTMRVVTYMIPAAEGEAEGAECAISYFGGGAAGGDVESNFDRWSSQFEGSPAPVRSDQEVDGMKVAKVEINGTYLAPSGPMMESAGKKESFRLLGAIVEAPEGKLFFKLTGPVKTVTMATGEFDALVASVKKK